MAVRPKVGMVVETRGRHGEGTAPGPRVVTAILEGCQVHHPKSDVVLGCVNYVRLYNPETQLHDWVLEARMHIDSDYTESTTFVAQERTEWHISQVVDC